MLANKAPKKASEILRRCASLLKQLRQHKWAWVFNEPVNAEELGCHDYYQVVKKPMDLGTVKVDPPKPRSS